MSLITFEEIIPSNEDYLQDIIYSELKNQCSWRDNRSDAIQDQLKFFDSYYTGKKKDKNDANSHINKEIIEDYLKESEKVHYNQMNEMNNTKTKFLELSINDSFSNENKNLFFFDKKNRYLNIVNFNYNYSLDENNEEYNIELTLEDIEKFYFDFDTNLRSLIIPQSNYFKKDNCDNFISMDMYSIYYSGIKNNLENLELDSFEKVFTLDEVPNQFMSNSLIDRFFILSNSDDLNDNIKNRITLFDNDFKIVDQKLLNKSVGNYFVDPFLKGDFFNHPSVVLIFNQNSEIILSDFRSKEPSEKKINNRINYRISDLKYLDDFKFILFSPKTISLFDMRFPSLPVSEFSLNINYKDMNIKRIYNTDMISNNFMGIDSSGKDYSFLIFDINGDYTTNEFFPDFIDTKLIQTSRIVDDSIGIIIEDKYLIDFIADEFGGLYAGTYRLINSNNFNSNSITKIESKFFNDDKNLLEKDPLANRYQMIYHLYEKFYNKHIYKNVNENINRIKYTNRINKKNSDKDMVDDEDEEEDLSDQSLSQELDDFHIDEDIDEDVIDFGTIKVNGKQQKVYKIENKRKFLEYLINLDEKQLEEEFDKNINSDTLKVENDYLNPSEEFKEKEKEFEWLFSLLDKKK